MKTELAEAFKEAGKYILSDHAKERIRQRIGLTTDESSIAWVRNTINNAYQSKQDGHKTHYVTEAYEVICDGMKVVTIKPTDSSNEYLTKINDVVSKEITKLLTKYRRELRKADIGIAEHQLNFLRAKNPNTKDVIGSKLTDSIDWKAAIEDEIKAIKFAAKRYGVEI